MCHAIHNMVISINVCRDDDVQVDLGKLSLADAEEGDAPAVMPKQKKQKVNLAIYNSYVHSNRNEGVYWYDSEVMMHSLNHPCLFPEKACHTVIR